jgi:hypothetical protein
MIAIRRVPLMAVGMLSMACGAWLGLVRLGWRLPLPWPDQLIAHGPLMVCGFLGTLISLERAVALGSFGPLLMTAGSGMLVVIFVVLLRRQPSLFMLTMALGAVAWLVGNGLWLDGSAIFRVVWWWLAFLVLTIAGERLELNRVLRPTSAIRAAFLGAISVLALGVVVSGRSPEAGVRIAGAGLLALALWLARHDVARRTVRQSGVTRYMAVGLLTGYAWLAFGGLAALVSGVAAPGLVYDATLHGVFLGFVMSMVFAHAPVIFPAILGRPLVYAPRFYAHLVVLHASLILRMVGDLSDDLARWRVWGGLLNAAALALFVINVGRSMSVARRPVAPARPEQSDQRAMAPMSARP